MIVDFDVLKSVEHLNFRRSGDLGDFGPNTCCDYVDSLHVDGSRCGVVVFIEPCGNIIKWGSSFEEVLNWWMVVFSTQPPHWDYCRAGWHLKELAERGLPDDALAVWSVEGAG